MRSAWLLLLAGCHRAEDPAYIQSLLTRTPIPAATLRDILEIRPGELQIVGGPAPDLVDDPAPPLWELRNAGRRPLWIHRSELDVVVDVDPLVDDGGLCGDGSTRPPRRPVFEADGWILLRPGDRAPFRLPSPYAWGRAEFWAIVGSRGKSLVWEAESFNAGDWVGTPKGWAEPAYALLGQSWCLPPFSWAADVRPHAFLALSALDGGRFRWESPVERPDPLALEAWVLSEDRALVYQGPLAVDSHRSGATDYRLPAALPGGTYRILAVAKKAGAYLTRVGAKPHERYVDGISRWIPFSVGASSGSPGGAAPRD